MTSMEECDRSLLRQLNIAVVILNYDSFADLVMSAQQFYAQCGVMLSVIVVDNASPHDSIEQVKQWLLEWRPNSIIGSRECVAKWIDDQASPSDLWGRVYLIQNTENRGFSVGNNVGIRLAERMGADGVVIANPDVRIDDDHYLAKLSQALFSSTINVVAASRILGLDGKDQNPLREPTFWEEVLWFRCYLPFVQKYPWYVVPVSGENPLSVQKVSGCCLMMRMSFIREIGYLDENVFMYCEEPILAAQVRKSETRIIYLPNLTAIHAHVVDKRGSSAVKMRWFLKSRLYYIETYSGYNAIQRKLLHLSYSLVHLKCRAWSAKWIFHRRVT